MHYLEDDLDLLDGATDELKAQCFEMRELDGRVEKALSDVREESRVFFTIVKNLGAEEREFRHQKIKEEYRRIREMSEEKLAISEFLELMLEKYQERIAKDLNEFKVELEADTLGITQTIEKELCETIKIACNQKKVKSLVVTIPFSALNNNETDGLGEAEDSGFEDVKPSTSGNYRYHTNKISSHSEHSINFKASSLDDGFMNLMPSRYQKRGSISGQSLGSHCRHSTIDNSFLTDSSDFLPPPIKKKLQHSTISSPSTMNQLNNSVVERKAERKNSRFLTPKLTISTSGSVLAPHHRVISNGPVSHRDRSSLRQFPSSKHKKMLTFSSVSSGSQRWSPFSSNYLNNNGNNVLPTGESSSASASTTPSPTPQNSGNAGPLVGRLASSGSSQTIGYHYSSGSTTQASTLTALPPMNSSVSSSTLAMPAFAGGQESQYGRPVKLTSRVQQMLKDRQTHRSGRLPSSANLCFPPPSPASVRYKNSASFSEDENRESSSGIRQRTLSNTQRRRRVIVEDDELDDRTGTPSFDEEEEEEEHDLEDEENDVNGELNGEENADELDEENGEEDEDQDNNVWCVCRQKSEGDMVACDNKNCLYEWFHYECVGITAPPRGKWFCPVCTKNMRRSRSFSMESH